MRGKIRGPAGCSRCRAGLAARVSGVTSCPRAVSCPAVAGSRPIRHLHQRGLADAVAADDATISPLPDGLDALQDRRRAVAGAQVVDLEQRIGGHQTLPR